MVKVIDITPEREREEEQGRLELTLVRQCFFPPTQVKRLTSGCIVVFDASGEPLASKIIEREKMKVYNESVLPQAEEFGKRYEEQFHISAFTIETDYSGK